MRALLLVLLTGPLAAAPTDAELLAQVKNRATLERVTPVPVDMAAAVAARCSIDAVLQAGLHRNARFHVFASAPAALPLFDPGGRFPEGSLLVKEKFDRESDATVLFTGMWKREKGYFPECGDWEFFTVDAAVSKVVERGKLARCASCHEGFGDRDHVSKNYIKPAQLSGGRIVLHASTAQVHGTKLRYEPEEKKNTLGFWTDPSDRASWTFEVTMPRRFAVHVWQGCGKGSGGAEVEIRANGQRLRFTVEDTGHFQNFKERKIGVLSFDEAGPRTLEVTALSKPGPAVMDLRQILLVPLP